MNALRQMSVAKLACGKSPCAWEEGRDGNLAEMGRGKSKDKTEGAQLFMK